MKKKTMFLLAGVFFGFSLSRVGAAEYDLIYAMFAAEDFKLAWVMLSAIIVGFIGMRVLFGTGGRSIDGNPVAVNKKRLSRLNAAGGILFGIGWGMSGACPGTILAQLGEGKLLGLFTLAGIITGTYIYALLVERFPSLDIF